MSGGVDSSVAAFLMKDQGYEVTGVTMCLGAGDIGESRCCGLNAVEDARRVCDRLGIPHYVFDFAGEMEERVINKFVSEYNRGRTPNPCIDCNRYLKFGSLLDKAQALGFDYLATGHYAAINRGEKGYSLAKGRDGEKDQTYFLYTTPYDALARILFPLASLTKRVVRDIARKAELPAAEKAESQDLCFVGRHEYPDFIARRLQEQRPGPIVNRKGKRLGTHRGIASYTVGQRSGLGIAHPVPLYVLAIDAPANRLTVGEKRELAAQGLIAGDLNILLKGDWPEEITAKIRYRRPAAACRVIREQERMEVIFKETEEAITPGQAVVIYHDDQVLGGGVIEEVLHATG